MEKEERCHEIQNKPSFGKDMRKKFMMRDNATYLNHGAYGMVPKVVKDAQQRYIDEMDQHPDDWYRRQSWRRWIEARNIVASSVNADADDVVFVPNVTSGINAVLKSFPFQQNSGLLATNLTYLPVRHACVDKASKIDGGKAHFLEIKFPIESEESLVEQYRQYLNEHDDVNLAVIEHVNGPTGMQFPVEKILSVCRDYGVLSIVDGAHAPGQLNIDIRKLNPDIYIGAFHKWCFTPRSSAMMYVNKKHQEWISPLVTSARYKKGMVEEFYGQGCYDYSPYLCVPAAICFIEEIGGMQMPDRPRTRVSGRIFNRTLYFAHPFRKTGQVVEYNSKLLDRACEMMTTSWSTSTLPIPKSMEAPCMRMVQIPLLRDYKETTEDAARLHTDIYEKHNVQVQTILLNGKIHIRLSAQIYNDLSDFQELVKIICDMMV